MKLMEKAKNIILKYHFYGEIFGNIIIFYYICIKKKVINYEGASRTIQVW